MALIVDGIRVCGATATMQGRCERCGYQPDPAAVVNRNVRHRGVCSKCGGRMMCMRRVTRYDACIHHKSQLKQAVDVNRVRADRQEALLRGVGSKLPPDLQQLYIQAFEDPRLLSLRSEVALFTVRQMQLAERLNTGESTQLWAELVEAKAKFQNASERLSKARKDNNADEIAEASTDAERALKLVFRIIDTAIEREECHNELLALTERLASLKRMQHARLRDMKQSITPDQALELVAALVGSVRRNVRDRDTLARIETDLVSALRLPSPAALPASQATLPATVESRVE